MKRTKASDEPTAYAEIGAYLHKYPGKAQVKTYTSVNEPLKVDAAEETKQIRKVRVEVHVKEDRSVKNGQVYQKDVDTVQISDSPDSENSSTETSSFDDPLNTKGPLSTAEHFLKNMVDKLSDRVGINTALAVCAIVLGALALGLVLS